MALMKLPRFGTDDVRYNVYLSTERIIIYIYCIKYAKFKALLMTLTIEMYLFLCDAVSIDLSGNMSAQDEIIKK